MKVNKKSISIDNQCVQCKSAIFIDSKVRHVKKENPCLMDPRDVK